MYFRLVNNKIIDAGAVALADALKVNKTLSELRSFPFALS
jgi:hypothetical protein